MESVIFSVSCVINGRTFLSVDSHLYAALVKIEFFFLWHSTEDILVKPGEISFFIKHFPILCDMHRSVVPDLHFKISGRHRILLLFCAYAECAERHHNYAEDSE